MAARRARRSPGTKKRKAPPEPGIQGAPLEPIRYVQRELTRPDGSKVRAKVPVYPPFQLNQPTAVKAGERKKAS